ncbi:cyclic pyranopterin monophosphate synthase MoaC [bacterium]
MGFTHFNSQGRAYMVDITEKNETQRTALARGSIKMKQETIESIKQGHIKKGDVLSVAQVAGVMSAKNTSSIIPMSHNINLTSVDVRFDVCLDEILIQSEVKCTGKTGVEMEALTVVSVTALTIYDMCKSIDKDMLIKDIRLIKKQGGKSGDYLREE